ncbi:MULTISPECIES: hypothetical protein [Rhizobium/Agrobacterium group]|uniref:hypothetical protein n=1 Tax=Rhizobium/Agrobacterium group TaxID=227290 RepID=UPI00115BDFAE|nr:MULTISPECIES: hypothetical protein [Rhizobium/Agrobacterium group]MCZ7926187.1 hypothetical protein [Agrobacterium pusense]CAD7041318.1 hypothetical protein RP007_00735 [Rhizobium sp. P007]
MFGLHENIALEVGDAVRDGERIKVHETAEYELYWVRDGDLVKTVPVPKKSFMTELFEKNKEARNEFSNTSKLGNQVRVAQIPLWLYMRLERSGIVEDKKTFARLLNDPNYANFRVNNLRV